MSVGRNSGRRALLTVCPLMGGEMPLMDRVKEAFRITKEAACAGQEESDQVETVLYVMADYNVPYKVDTARERDCLKC